MRQFQRAIIIGASSGMGEALATQLAAQGAQVALVARREAELAHIQAQLGAERCYCYVHDVQERDKIPTIFQQIAHDMGGVDLVVYAAGIMPDVGPDEYNTVLDVEILSINLLGAIAWLNEAAARFARTGNGTIIGISSVAGDRGRRANPAYATSKAALTTYLEALRNRLSVKGVTVLTIKPGYVATPMLAGAKISKLFPVIPADRAAREILTAAAKQQQVAYVPAVWRPIMGLVRAIPSRLFRRLNV